MNPSSPPNENLSTPLTSMEPEPPQSYWSWSRQDCFPEPSFQTWQAYKTSLSQTVSRLKDRFFNRSTDENEVQVQIESGSEMKKCLTWWDLMWFAFGAVVGNGVFVLTGQEAHNHAGPAVVISYAISGLSALISVFCYTEFAVEVPVAGGSFSYLRIELGDFVAFIAAGNILLEAVVGAAGLSRAWTSYFTTFFSNQPDRFRIHVSSFADGFNLLDPIAVVVLIVTSSIPMFGTRNASYLNWGSGLITAALIVFVIVAGFIKGKPENLSPFVPYGAGGVFQGAAVLFWAYTGFDMVATMAEETKNPARDIPIALIGSMTMIIFVYCLMGFALCYMVKYTVMDVNAAFSVAFKNGGWNWASILVSLVALKGMTTGSMVGALGQGRYTTQIARTHMIPPWFARVHPTRGTPINAMLLVTLTSACIGFFTSLDVLSSVSSLSTLFVFMLMGVALIVRRYYVSEVSSKSHLWKLWIFLLMVIGSSVGTSAYYYNRPNGWIGYALTLPIWFLGTLGIAVLPQQRAPKVWGVPLVPWLPSLSIVVNLFLIGALGYQAFVRFAICTGVMLIYYVFFSLHATYDVAYRKPSDLETLQMTTENS